MFTNNRRTSSMVGVALGAFVASNAIADEQSIAKQDAPATATTTNPDYAIALAERFPNDTSLFAAVPSLSEVFLEPLGLELDAQFELIMNMIDVTPNEYGVELTSVEFMSSLGIDITAPAGIAARGNARALSVGITDASTTTNGFMSIVSMAGVSTSGEVQQTSNDATHITDPEGAFAVVIRNETATFVWAEDTQYDDDVGALSTDIANLTGSASLAEVPAFVETIRFDNHPTIVAWAEPRLLLAALADRRRGAEARAIAAYLTSEVEGAAVGIGQDAGIIVGIANVSIVDDSDFNRLLVPSADGENEVTQLVASASGASEVEAFRSIVRDVSALVSDAGRNIDQLEEDYGLTFEELLAHATGEWGVLLTDVDSAPLIFVGVDSAGAASIVEGLQTSAPPPSSHTIDSGWGPMQILRQVDAEDGYLRWEVGLTPGRLWVSTDQGQLAELVSSATSNAPAIQQEDPPDTRLMGGANVNVLELAIGSTELDFDEETTEQIRANRTTADVMLADGMLQVRVQTDLSEFDLPSLLYAAGGPVDMALRRNLSRHGHSGTRYMYDRATREFMSSDPTTAQFPASIGPLPSFEALEAACLNDEQLNYELLAEVPILEGLSYGAVESRYVYQFESSGTGEDATFTASAFGDLDCDGVYSTVSISATVVDGEVRMGTRVVEQELE